MSKTERVEDLAFRYLEPTAFEDISKGRWIKKRKVNEAFLAEIAGALDAIHCRKPRTSRRAWKDAFKGGLQHSIRSCARQRITIDQVYDLLAVRSSLTQ